MPIYEYLCNSCGVKKEHIQKMSDAPIKVCPECGSESYIKQISAAGFQLKGSGWYVTDFKNKPAPAAAKSEKSETQTQSSDTNSDTKTESKSDSKTSISTSTSSAQTSDSKTSTAAATD